MKTPTKPYKHLNNRGLGRFWTRAVIGLLVAAGAFPAFANENLVPNGDFATGLDGWIFVLRDVDGERQIDDFHLEWLSTDGAMQVTMPAIDEVRHRAHRTGASTSLATQFEPGQKIKIQFSAMRVDGAPYLMVTRAHGGGQANIVRLEQGEWREFEVFDVVEFEQYHPLFMLVGQPASDSPNIVTAEGTFAIRDVIVTLAE